LAAQYGKLRISDGGKKICGIKRGVERSIRSSLMSERKRTVSVSREATVPRLWTARKAQAVLIVTRGRIVGRKAEGGSRCSQKREGKSSSAESGVNTDSKETRSTLGEGDVDCVSGESHQRGTPRLAGNNCGRISWQGEKTTPKKDNGEIEEFALVTHAAA